TRPAQRNLTVLGGGASEIHARQLGNGLPGGQLSAVEVGDPAAGAGGARGDGLANVGNRWGVEDHHADAVDGAAELDHLAGTISG
ncbi:hypothetical protein DF186_20540, partial [Enterococcus hirae]